MPKATTVFWNERGQVNCADHAPYKGSDTWNWERWQTLSATEQQAFRAETGITGPLCETCRHKAERSAS